MSRNMVTSSSLLSLSLPTQFDAMADAYLDSAQRLCRVLERSTCKATYERGMAVMYLAHHSIELFLKGMVLRKEAHEKFSHDLEPLGNRYHALYPAKKFKLDIPFSVSTSGVKSEDNMRAQCYIRTRTERLRYPIDKAGMPWGGVHGFEALSFRIRLEQLALNYTSIREHVID